MSDLMTLGMDVGSLFTKAALLVDDELAASRIVATTGTIGDRIDDLIDVLLREADVARAGLAGVVSTGRGGDLAAAADFEEEDLHCVGAAANHLLPEVEMVIDIGGQSITAMMIDAGGDVLHFMRNDKCASGTGRYLEVMSQALGLTIEELSASAAGAASPVQISDQCGVFVESEVITHLNDGADVGDIAAGLCDAVARIVVAQARRLGGGADTPYSITGGVGRVEAVVRRVRDRLGGQYSPFPVDPRLAAALGAGLFAGGED